MEMEVLRLMYELRCHQLEQQSLLEMQRELEISLDKYIKLYNEVSVGYFILNNTGLVVDANRAGACLLGLSIKEIINRSFLWFVSEEFQLLFSHFRQLALKKQSPKPCELKLLRRDMPPIFVQCSCEIINNKEQEFKELLIVVTDITERKNAEEAMCYEKTVMESLAVLCLKVLSVID